LAIRSDSVSESEPDSDQSIRSSKVNNSIDLYTLVVQYLNTSLLYARQTHEHLWRPSPNRSSEINDLHLRPWLHGGYLEAGLGPEVDNYHSYEINGSDSRPRLRGGYLEADQEISAEHAGSSERSARRRAATTIHSSEANNALEAKRAEVRDFFKNILLVEGPVHLPIDTDEKPDMVVRRLETQFQEYFTWTATELQCRRCVMELARVRRMVSSIIEILLILKLIMIQRFVSLS
jgi:hypothetical protein